MRIHIITHCPGDFQWQMRAPGEETGEHKGIPAQNDENRANFGLIVIYL